MKKMNNKGFSLVELIVVVLIMAIIAVALAPQVMKWVENSRQATDRDTYEQMVSNIQLALTDKDLGSTIDQTIIEIIADGTYAKVGSGTKAKVTAAQTAGTKNLLASLDKIAADWYKAKMKSEENSGASGKITPQITVSTTKMLSRTTEPYNSNTDLS